MQTKGQRQKFLLGGLAAAFFFFFLISLSPAPVDHFHSAVSQWGNLFKEQKVAATASSEFTKMLVIPRMKDQDISWAVSYLPDYGLSTFIADDPEAPNHPTVNKGNEASTYLTYILLNYEKLPDISVFVHAHQSAWHNNELHDRDTVKMLKKLRVQTVLQEGYVNLRCETSPGCPATVHPLDHPDSSSQDISFAKAFTELWPNVTLPRVVGTPCCAQFAVSRDAIRSHPIEYYELLQQWLISTDISSVYSGRFFEYAWHIMFGKPAVHCVDTRTCYCGLYGDCFASDEAFNNVLRVKSESMPAVDTFQS